MATKKATRHSCSYDAPMSTYQDVNHYSEFVHGSKLAAGAFVVMFIFLSMGVVIFGW